MSVTSSWPGVQGQVHGHATPIAQVANASSPRDWLFDVVPVHSVLWAGWYYPESQVGVPLRHLWPPGGRDPCPLAHPQAPPATAPARATSTPARALTLAGALLPEHLARRSSKATQVPPELGKFTRDRREFHCCHARLRGCSRWSVGVGGLPVNLPGRLEGAGDDVVGGSGGASCLEAVADPLLGPVARGVGDSRHSDVASPSCGPC